MLADALQELVMRDRSEHPNVLRVLCYCSDPPALVTEFCGQGSLHTFIGHARERPNPLASFPWSERCVASPHTLVGCQHPSSCDRHEHMHFAASSSSPALRNAAASMQIEASVSWRGAWLFQDKNLDPLLDGNRELHSRIAACAGSAWPVTQPMA